MALPEASGTFAVRPVVADGCADGDGRTKFGLPEGPTVSWLPGGRETVLGWVTAADGAGLAAAGARVKVFELAGGVLMPDFVPVRASPVAGPVSCAGRPAPIAF
jgi:hypothetical protein